MLTPSPPWRFSNARVLYQPTFVPVEAARAVTPTRPDLTILSLFGWTLGGIFVVDWTQSPIGPYREVAVLSALVTRDFNIGAWASHIVVTTPDAVDAGRELYGLPTTLGSIDFETSESSDVDELFQGFKDTRSWLSDVLSDLASSLKYAAGTAIPGIAESSEKLNKSKYAMPQYDENESQRGFIFSTDGSIVVKGWESLFSDIFIESNNQKSDEEKGNFSRKGISLPSFSGRLKSSNGKVTPLLQYPLRLESAQSLRFRPPMKTKVASHAVLSPSLRAVLDGPCASPCIQVDGVEIVAGEPIEIMN